MALFKKKSVQLIAYANETVRNVTVVFSAIEREALKMGLTVTAGKAKYMLSTGRGGLYGTMLSI